VLSTGASRTNIAVDPYESPSLIRVFAFIRG